MANGYVESKGAVETFLIDLKRILNNRNSVLRIETREDKPLELTNKYCMATLGYDKNDEILGRFSCFTLKRKPECTPGTGDETRGRFSCFTFEK